MKMYSPDRWRAPFFSKSNSFLHETSFWNRSTRLLGNGLLHHCVILHSRSQSLRSFWPAAEIESSGSNHFKHAPQTHRKSKENNMAEQTPISFPEFRSPWPAVEKREPWEQPFWNNKGNKRILVIRLTAQPSSITHACNGCFRSSCFTTASQGERRLWERDWC